MKELGFIIQGLPQLDPVQIIDASAGYEGGENISIHFSPAENAESYRYRLYDEDGNCIESAAASPSGAVNFAGYRLEPSRYSLEIKAYADNYTDSTAVWEFTVGEKAPAPVVLGVDKTTLSEGEEAEFVIQAPGAEALMARSRRDAGSSCSYNYISIFEDVTSWMLSPGWGEGTRVFDFAALVDGKWTDWSQTQAITVNGTGVVLQPIELDLSGVSDNVFAGSDLEVPVTADGASGCYVDLYNSSNIRVYGTTVYFNEGQTAVIPGYLLTPGRMIIRAEAYGSGYTSSTAEKTVTVAYNSDRPAAPAVTPAEQNVAAGNRAGFELPAAGDDWSADRIVVRYYRSGYSSNVRYSEWEPSSQGNTTRWSDYSRGAGEEWKYAFAVRVDGVWSRWSNTCTANTDM